MNDESLQKSLEQFCRERDINPQDVDDLIELYTSDAPEDEVLDRIARYPLAARELVSSAILPPFSQQSE